MRRERLEEAISGLNELLDRNAPEQAFQDFFENHAVVLETLGYIRWIARPKLSLTNGRSYVPDFLAQLASGVWQVLDLKTPAERILLERDRRKAFAATMTSYIAQLHEYREYFADAAHRAACRRDIGVEIHEEPDMVIIAGRDATVDAIEIHRHCRRQNARLQILTFDHVVSALEHEHARNYGDLEGLAGLSFFSRIRIHPNLEHRRKYLSEVWDVGGSSCSIYLDEHNRLTLETIGPNSYGPTVSGAVVPEELYGRWLVLSCELGSGPDGVILQLRIDDRIIATQMLTGEDLSLINMDRGVMGADRARTRGAAFDMTEHQAYGRILSFPERQQLTSYLFERNENGVTTWVEFNGSTWMEFDASTGDRTLRQPNDAFRPKIRDSAKGP